MTFDHPLFQDRWSGCTTESLRRAERDEYDQTAGTIGLRPTNQADSSKHLFFVDVAVRTNDGREIVLERIEGGKLLSSLLDAQEAAQATKEEAVYYSCQAAWREKDERTA